MAKQETYSCPVCDTQVRFHTASCPRCEADLSAVAMLSETPDLCYNMALDAVRTEQWTVAILHLAAALHYHPSDAGSWVLLGKVLAQLQRAEEARYCFHMAVWRAPDNEAAVAALKASGGGPTELEAL